MGFALKLAVLFSCLPLSAAEFHALQYFYTATSGVTNIPTFISVGMVDGVEISCYDSNLKRIIPKQTWMERLDQQYWGSETELSQMYERLFRVDLNILRRRFNHTEGVHVLQKTYGCQWDDDSGAIHGFEQFGYDGEDFLTLDLENMRWIAPVPQALPSKLKLDDTERYINRDIYFKETCVEWLKKYVDYGSSTLGRKVSPEVSVFQRGSSAVCHATGFYPDRVMITWRRDGVEEQEEVDVLETLPNEDGTFQKRVVLTVSPEERKKSHYTCEVAHISGEPIMPLIEEDYKTQNMGNRIDRIVAVVAVVVAVAVAIVIKVTIVMMKGCHHPQIERESPQRPTSLHHPQIQREGPQRPTSLHRPLIRSESYWIIV